MEQISKRPVSDLTLYDVLFWRERRPELSLTDIANMFQRDPEDFAAQIAACEQNGRMARVAMRLWLNGRISTALGRAYKMDEQQKRIKPEMQPEKSVMVMTPTERQQKALDMIAGGVDIDRAARAVGYKSAGGMRVAFARSGREDPLPKKQPKAKQKTSAPAPTYTIPCPPPQKRSSTLRPIGYKGKYATYVVFEEGASITDSPHPEQEVLNAEQLRAYAEELLEVAARLDNQ